MISTGDRVHPAPSHIRPLELNIYSQPPLVRSLLLDVFNHIRALKMRTGVEVTLQPLCRVRHHEADHPPPTSHSSSTRHTGRVAALGPFSRINLLRPFSFFFSRRFFSGARDQCRSVSENSALARPTFRPFQARARARRSDRRSAVQCSAGPSGAVRCGPCATMVSEMWGGGKVWRASARRRGWVESEGVLRVWCRGDLGGGKW